jgi:hypothetical protein
MPDGEDGLDGPDHEKEGVSLVESAVGYVRNAVREG